MPHNKSVGFRVKRPSYYILYELSNLSTELQSHSITLMEVDRCIKRCIRVINYFKTHDGEHMAQAVIATDEMEFKNIKLTCNKKLICINKNQFLTSIENNLMSRFLENESEKK